MIGQIFLTTLLAGILVYAASAYRKAPAIGLMAVAAALAGLYFVWMPAQATLIAHQAGIGRGVDLIIYTWVLISLLIVINLHLKLRAQSELITKLARSVALADADRSTPPTKRLARRSRPRASAADRVRVPPQAKSA